MNFIYDITVNMNTDLYNFYEWDSNDNINFYLKMPIFKIDNETMNDFINSSFIINKSFLSRIYKKSNCYSKICNHDYVSSFSDGERVLVVSFDAKGESVYKSYLSIDEEEDILEYTKLLKYSIIEYKVKEKNKSISYITRKEKYIRNYTSNILKRIINNKESDKLKYIFYEIYNKKENDDNLMYMKLKNLIDNNIEKLDYIKKIFDSLEYEEKKFRII